MPYGMIGRSAICALRKRSIHCIYTPSQKSMKFVGFMSVTDDVISVGIKLGASDFSSVGRSLEKPIDKPLILVGTFVGIEKGSMLGAVIMFGVGTSIFPRMSDGDINGIREGTSEKSPCFILATGDVKSVGTKLGVSDLSSSGDDARTNSLLASVTPSKQLLDSKNCSQLVSQDRDGSLAHSLLTSRMLASGQIRDVKASSIKLR